MQPEAARGRPHTGTLWLKQLRLDLVSTLAFCVHLIYIHKLTDCCKLPCHSYCVIFDGGIFIECSTRANYPADLTGQTWFGWSENSGTLIVNPSWWCWFVKLVLFL
jgi:hypothetical protein